MKSVTSKIRIEPARAQRAADPAHAAASAHSAHSAPSAPSAPSATRRSALHAGLALGGAGLLGASGPARAAAGAAPVKPPLSVAFVYVSPIADAGWTTQHDRGRQAMVQALGDKVRTKHVENVAEGPDAERVIRDLAGQGAQLIFTTSFGYMEPTLRVAREFPDTVFEHATGYKTAANLGTYNARFYEGRYLAGLVAGRMTKSNVAGYVAAFPIPEVLQGINAFVLGMRATNPKAELKVIWTSSWFDPGKEKEAAQTLINQGADVLTHHTDSTAVVGTAEEKGKWSVGYHSDMAKFAPKGQLCAVTHHWGEFYAHRARQVLDGTWKPETVWAGIRDGFIRLEGLNAALPKDLRDLVKTRGEAIAAGRFHPFADVIVDNAGQVRQAKGTTMSDDLLNRMDFYVQGVQGALPKR